MGWAVETLDETVESEVRALPEDMRPKPARIAKFIEEKGLDRVRDPHVSIWKAVCGRCGLKAAANFTRALRDSLGLARGDRARLHEEDAENAAERDRHGVIPREVDSMMEV
jgi:hypothetical protein